MSLVCKMMNDQDPKVSYQDLFEHEEKKPLLSYKTVGFFVPILGIIFYFVLRKEKKDIADAFLDGSIIGLFTFTIVTLLLVGYFLSI